ncbi:MAG: 50S ribosomal protein L11 methyltransferase [Verrucomicrobia bacterium]|nr:50S ribosomal protein L11 methyltransferase [Verrucomicrobiota bacterium]
MTSSIMRSAAMAGSHGRPGSPARRQLEGGSAKRLGGSPRRKGSKSTGRAVWRVGIEVAPEAEARAAAGLAGITGQAAAVEWRAGRPSIWVGNYLARLPAPADALRRRLLELLAKLAKPGLASVPGRVRIRRLRRENWAESWRRHFRAFEVGDRLLIRPSWSRRRARPGQAAITLDPGLSFGTGHHPTTRFCLEQLARGRRRGQRQAFLDVGTGSGILALAAVRLGYRPVDAWDHDPAAVQIARANRQRNPSAGHVRFRLADVRSAPFRKRGIYDMICANLEFGLLREEGQRIVSWLRPGGRLVMAGILRGQFAALQAACRQWGLRRAATRAEGEWRSGAWIAEKPIRK